MNRKAKCKNCGNWFYNHNGLFIALPDTYDDGMCPACNRKIDADIDKSNHLDNEKGKTK